MTSIVTGTTTPVKAPSGPTGCHEPVRVVLMAYETSASRIARLARVLDRDERQQHALARRHTIELKLDRIPTGLRDDDPHFVTIANASFLPLA